MQYLETMSVSFLEGRCHFSVQSFCQVRLVTPLIVAGQGSLSITSPWSLLKPMSIESVMPSNQLILCHPLLLLPSIFPSNRDFSNESVLCIRWPNYWSFNVSICPSNEYSELISFRVDWFDLLEVQVTLKSLLKPQSSEASVLLLTVASQKNKSKNQCLNFSKYPCTCSALISNNYVDHHVSSFLFDGHIFKVQPISFHTLPG